MTAQHQLASIVDLETHSTRVVAATRSSQLWQHFDATYRESFPIDFDCDGLFDVLRDHVSRRHNVADSAADDPFPVPLLQWLLEERLCRPPLPSTAKLKPLVVALWSYLLTLVQTPTISSSRALLASTRPQQ